MFAAPPEIPTEIVARLPDELRRPVRSDWADVNKSGEPIDSFLEGPSFDRAGHLWLVDIPHGRVLRLAPDGRFTLVASYDGQPNGLKLHRDGTVWIADYKQGILSLDPATGAVTPRVVRHRLEGFKGCNDLHFHANGDLYFTDQGQTGLHDPTGRVFRLGADGALAPILTGIPSPNGILLNPRGTHLYVAVTRANQVWRGPFVPDGGLSKVGAFIQMSGGSGPDGMAMDEAGNLAVAHPGMGSVWLFSPAGEPIARIRSCTGSFPTNVAYGDADMRGLYITESDSGTILRARMPVPGCRLFGLS